MGLGRETVYRGVHVKADFKLDRDGFRKIALSRKVRKAVHDVVKDHAKPIAEGLAGTFSETGRYRDSFKIHDTQVVAGPPTWKMLRASAQLYNSAKKPGAKQSYALVVEVGDQKHTAHHVLAKTLAQMVASGIVTMRPKALKALSHNKKKKRRTRRPKT